MSSIFVDGDDIAKAEVKTKKRQRRKLTQEQVDSINRSRELRDGPPSIEHSRFRVFLDESGRAVELDITSSSTEFR